MDRALISKADAARSLGVSWKTVSRWEQDAGLNFPRSFRIKVRKYFYAEEVAGWIKKQEKQSQAA